MQYRSLVVGRIQFLNNTEGQSQAQDTSLARKKTPNDTTFWCGEWAYVMAKYHYPVWLNEFEQECPHKHFKNKVVDRDFLSRKQHLDLLCTPRGYRWEVAYEISSDKNRKNIDRECDPSKRKLTHPKAHVYNILAELWTVVTPEMIDKLKVMLMEEFGLPEPDAVDFMCKQVQETMLIALNSGRAQENRDPDDLNTVDKQPYSKNPRLIQLDLEKPERLRELSPGINPAYVKNFSNAVSKKLAEVLTTSMCSKRTKKHRMLANFILESLCNITGDHCTMESANTVLQKAQTFIADKFALWVLRNVKDEDAQRERKRALEDADMKERNNAKIKERQQREKERERLAKKLERQKKLVEKAQSERNMGQEDEKKRKQREREEKFKEWMKRDEENKKQEERDRKERAAKMKKDRQEKAHKEAEMKEQIAKDNAARKKRHEEILARQKMEEKRQEKAKRRDSLKKSKQK